MHMIIERLRLMLGCLGKLEYLKQFAGIAQQQSNGKAQEMQDGKTDDYPAYSVGATADGKPMITIWASPTNHITVVLTAAGVNGLIKLLEAWERGAATPAVQPDKSST